MSLPTRRPRGARIALVAVVSLGLASGAAIGAALPAVAAPSSFIAAPNGMVGVPEIITIKAPSAVGQVVTIGLQLGPAAETLQTTIGPNGFGAVTWTPTGAGGWTVSGLGSIASAGSTSVSVAAMPTVTVLLAQNQLQQGVGSSLLGAVTAPIGVLAPTGTLTLSTSTGAVLSTAPLSGLYGGTTATATLPWTPSTSGDIPVQASYQPASGGQLASTSAVSQPNVAGSRPTVAMRWPTNLYVGTTTVLQAVLGQGMPEGSAAFLMDGKGISGSIGTVNGVASLQWSPPSSGIHTIAVNYTGNTPGFSGSSSQVVNVLPARTADVITVDPPGQPAWSISQQIIMNAGASFALAGTSVSGTTVLFSEQGPCVIAGATLTALGTGQCQVTAQSPGSASLTPGSATYTVTIQKPPRRPRR